MTAFVRNQLPGSALSVSSTPESQTRGQATVMSGGEDLDAIFFLPDASHFEMFRGYHMRRKRNNAAWKYKEDYEIHGNLSSQLISILGTCLNSKLSLAVGKPQENPRDYYYETSQFRQLDLVNQSRPFQSQNFNSPNLLSLISFHVSFKNIVLLEDSVPDVNSNSTRNQFF